MSSRCPRCTHVHRIAAHRPFQSGYGRQRESATSNKNARERGHVYSISDLRGCLHYSVVLFNWMDTESMIGYADHSRIGRIEIKTGVFEPSIRDKRTVWEKKFLPVTHICARVFPISSIDAVNDNSFITSLAASSSDPSDRAIREDHNCQIGIHRKRASTDVLEELNRFGPRSRWPS